jgi:hypothetical protein
MPTRRKADQGSRTPKENWRVEALRWTTFLVDNSEPVGLHEWWPKIANVPKSDSAQRQNFVYVERGTIGDNSLTLQWQPGRVDWLFSIKPPEKPTMEKLNDQIKGFDRLQSIELAQKHFEQSILRWFKTSPPAKRLAMGQVLLWPVGTRDAGYKLLAPFLKNSLKVTPDMRDLLYQVNRPRKSKSVKGVEINRLSKWMVAQLNPLLIEVGPEHVSREIGPDAFAVRLELDISTIPKATAPLFKRNNQSELFKEFSTLSDELCQNGDLP